MYGMAHFVEERLDIVPPEQGGSSRSHIAEISGQDHDG